MALEETLGDLCLIFLFTIFIGVFLIGGVWGLVLLSLLNTYPYLWAVLIALKVIIGMYSFARMHSISKNRVAWLFIGYFFPLLSLFLVWYYRKQEGL